MGTLLITGSVDNSSPLVNGFRWTDDLSVPGGITLMAGDYTIGATYVAFDDDFAVANVANVVNVVNGLNAGSILVTDPRVTHNIALNTFVPASFCRR